MAVRSFATNNLVEDHDNYVKFMNARAVNLKKEGKNTDILFYKKGMVSDVFKIDTSHKNGDEKRYKESSKIVRLTSSIKLWHTITLTYEIWCNCVKYLVDESHTRINYKKFVNVPDAILVRFKNHVKLAIGNAKCWYKTNGQKNIIDPCRSLAIYWTYLDIVKDTSHQRFFPTAETIRRAAKIFEYKQNDNPFIMNGKFQGYAVRGRKMEEKLVEENTSISNNTLLVDIIDDRRLTNPLYRVGIQTIGEFNSKTDKELLNIRTFGVSKLKRIREILSKFKPEESVIDIAEQAAKEVEEERKIDPMLSISKAKDEYDELIEIKEKYEALLKTAQEQADNYDKLLKEKMDLENYNSRLRDENNYLRDEYVGIEARLKNESSNTDIIAILSHVVDIMKKHGITKLETGIDGYSIDILQKFVITGRS